MGRPRNDLGFGLVADVGWTWPRTGHGQILGKFLAAAWTLALLSCGPSRTLPGHCPAVARMLRRICADCGGNCQVICEPSRQLWCQLWCGHSSVLGGMFPANCPDTSRQLPGNRPDNLPDAARMIRQTLRRTLCRMLRGLWRQLRSHLPTIAPTMVRTLARTFSGASCDVSRQLPGHVSVVARQLPG